jgi:hypothetical protein
MNTRKRTRIEPLEQLEEDIKQLHALLYGGRTPADALAEFRKMRDEEHLRDLFAAVAMHRLLERLDGEGRHLGSTWVAREAYSAAEAMLVARTQ